MQIAKIESSDGRQSLGLVDEGRLIPLDTSDSAYRSLTDILEAASPVEAAESLIDPQATDMSVDSVALQAPIDEQEVWAAGVTYKRSQTARMEESDVAALCYERVYQSDRPELFLKATPHRVRGPGMSLRIRSDSNWNVPEPELTLVMNSRLQLVGYTIGNDMSSPLI